MCSKKNLIILTQFVHTQIIYQSGITPAISSFFSLHFYFILQIYQQILDFGHTDIFWQRSLLKHLEIYQKTVINCFLKIFKLFQRVARFFIKLQNVFFQ